MKLTRTLLIVPIVGYYAWRRIAQPRGRRRSTGGGLPVVHPLVSVRGRARLARLIPAAWQDPLQRLALFAIVVALAGVGLASDLGRIEAAGLRPLTLGAILWVTIAVSSLAIARFITWVGRQVVGLARGGR